MATPTTFDTTKNAIDEFMLKEYESIASAHFDSQNGLRQQFRFYLLIAAVPVTILGLSFRDTPPHNTEVFNVFNLSGPLGAVCFAIGFLGVLMALSMVHTALDAVLYARTVNGIRAYFVERARTVGFELPPYLKMPTRQDRPRYFHVRAFFWQFALMGVVNGFYIAVWLVSEFHTPHLSVLAALLVLGGQILAYCLFCWHREKKELAI